MPSQRVEPEEERRGLPWDPYLGAHRLLMRVLKGKGREGADNP